MKTINQFRTIIFKTKSDKNEKMAGTEHSDISKYIFDSSTIGNLYLHDKCKLIKASKTMIS